MDKAERKKAIKQLLELIAENPEVADRITITIKPQHSLMTSLRRSRSNRPGG